MKFSEALRVIIDFAVDHDADIGLPFLADREKSLQAELLSVQDARKKLEEQKANIPDAPETTIREPTDPTASKAKAGGRRSSSVVESCIDKRPASTEKERFLTAVPYLCDGSKAISEEVRNRLLTQRDAHPDWVLDLQPEQQNRLRIMTYRGPFKASSPNDQAQEREQKVATTETGAS
jgi:hypothetical protein